MKHFTTRRLAALFCTLLMLSGASFAAPPVSSETGETKSGTSKAPSDSRKSGEDKATSGSKTLASLKTFAGVSAAAAGEKAKAAKEDTPPAAAVEAARKSLPGFLKPAFENKANLGFKPEDQIASVTLGAALRPWRFDSEVVEGMKPGQDLYDAVQPIEEWLFPVMVGREYRTLLFVRQAGGEWRGAFLGNFFLAGRFHDLREAWSGEKGAPFRVVSSISPRGYFFTVKGQPHSNLTPLTRIVLQREETLARGSSLRDLYKLEDILPALRGFWREEENSKVKGGIPFGAGPGAR